MRLPAALADDLAEAKKRVDKALQDKVRAKAVLETGVVAEGNGKL